MKNVEEVIKDYERNNISLTDLQYCLWGLSESSLNTISEEKLVYFLSLE